MVFWDVSKHFNKAMIGQIIFRRIKTIIFINFIFIVFSISPTTNTIHPTIIVHGYDDYFEFTKISVQLIIFKSNKSNSSIFFIIIDAVHVFYQSADNRPIVIFYFNF